VKPTGQIEETYYACFTASMFRLSASLAIKAVEMGNTPAPGPVSAAMPPLPPFSHPPCRDTMRADQQGVPSLMTGLPRMRHVSSHPILPEGGKRQMDDAPVPAERARSSVVPQPLRAAKSASRLRMTRRANATLSHKLAGYARLCGAHLANIQMVVRISAGPDQNNRERQASPARFRSTSTSALPDL
jgi:hypothetical protein